MNLGERIKKCRQEAGWSQEKVAEQLGVSRQSVTKWESGQSMPSTSNLFQLAQLFGTTVDFLKKEDALPQPPQKERVIVKTVIVEKKEIHAENQPLPKWLKVVRVIRYILVIIAFFTLFVCFMAYTYDNLDMMEIWAYIFEFSFRGGCLCVIIEWFAGKKQQ